MKYTIIFMSIGLLSSMPLSAMADRQAIQQRRQPVSLDAMRRNVQRVLTGLNRYRQRLNHYVSSFGNSIPQRSQILIQQKYNLIDAATRQIVAFNRADNKNKIRHYQALTRVYNQIIQLTAQQPAAVNNKPAATNNKPAAANNRPAKANNKPATKENAPAAPQQNNNNQAQTINCPICMDDIVASQCVRLSCGHTYCRGCLASLLNNAVRDRTVHVTCPDTTCRKEISDQDRGAITNNDNKVLGRFEERATDTWIDAHAKHCPNPKCHVIFEPEPNRRTLIICPGHDCGWRYCSRCLVDHPIKIACKDAAARSKDKNTDARVANELMRKNPNIKRCPKCKYLIEKDEGCLVMTCTACKHKFCWKCMRPWADHVAQAGGQDGARIHFVCGFTPLDQQPQANNWWVQALQPHQQPQPAVQQQPQWQGQYGNYAPQYGIPVLPANILNLQGDHFMLDAYGNYIPVAV